MDAATGCRLCSRLASFLDQVQNEHPDYFALPVPSFGQPSQPLLIVGLAPGMHGANRTGRPFTGDFAGILLYQSLHKFGFATSGEALDAAGNANPALSLKNCRLTNAVRCLPPQNKPELSEIKQCNRYLAQELVLLPHNAAVLALGTIAHNAVLMAWQLRKTHYPFKHGAQYQLPNGATLFDSYHCSRYNTNTKRLTTPMFEQVIANVAAQVTRRSAQ